MHAIECRARKNYYNSQTFLSNFFLCMFLIFILPLRQLFFFFLHPLRLYFSLKYFHSFISLDLVCSQVSHYKRCLRSYLFIHQTLPDWLIWVRPCVSYQEILYSSWYLSVITRGGRLTPKNVIDLFNSVNSVGYKDETVLFFLNNCLQLSIVEFPLLLFFNILDISNLFLSTYHLLNCSPPTICRRTNKKPW